MIELGQAPVIATPEQTFGFLSMPNLSGQYFPQAFQEQLGYPKETLEKALSGEFYFDEEGLARGSNLPILTLMNQKNLLPEGEHLLSIAEFGQAFNKNPEAFKRTYQDTGIIVRTDEGYIAKKIFKEINRRGIKPNPEKPVVLSITDLKLRKDRNSPYGFIFTLKDEAQPIVASAYGTKEPITKFTLYDERGIPIPDKEGKYDIWKSNVFGAAWVCSGCDQDASSYCDHLAGSSVNGRVAVGKYLVPQNLAEIKKIVSQGEKRIAEIRKDLEDRIAKL